MVIRAVKKAISLVQRKPVFEPIFTEAMAAVFDPNWYRGLYPDIDENSQDPLQHYLTKGYLENRSPNPLFDAEWYLQIYEDVRMAGIPAIIHYLSSGGNEWRRPSPWIDMNVYRKYLAEQPNSYPNTTALEDFFNSNDRLDAFQFFDLEYYKSQIEFELNTDPNSTLLHFFSFGIKEGLSPHRLIYLDNHNEKLNFSESFSEFKSFFSPGFEQSQWKAAAIFDGDFYKKKLGAQEINPVIHYLQNHHQKGLWPHPLFDADFYKRKYSVAALTDPLSHYLEKGRHEGAWPNAFFDPIEYKKNYSHHIKHNQTEIEHYAETGHLEWFEPSSKFGQRYYLHRHLTTNPNNVPALIHFLHGGSMSGATALPPKPFFDKVASLTESEIVERIKNLRAPKLKRPTVSIIIPVYNNLRYTLRCVLSILEINHNCTYEIIIIDDNSPDGSGAFIRNELNGYGRITVLNNIQNLGFLKTCNKAAGFASGKYIFLLNNDTYVTEGCLDELVETFERVPEAGLVGSKLVYPNGLLQEAGGVIWQDGSGANFGRLRDPQEPKFNYQRDVDYISGASIMIPREFWEDQGGFSEYLAPAYYEDTDFAMATRKAGRRVIYQPLSTVVHFEGISSGTDITSGAKKYQAINQSKFLERWRSQLSTHGNKGDFSENVVDRFSRARILVVDAEVPKPDSDSGSVTAFNYLKILTGLGYRVTFIPASLQLDGKYGRALQRIGVEVIHSPYFDNVLNFLLENGNSYDLFILSRLTTGARLFDELKSAFPDKPIVFDTVDLHHLRLMRESELSGDREKLETAQRWKKLELGTISKADATIVVSDYEVEYIQNQIGPFSNVVVPLIYDEYKRTTGFDDRTDIAFIGGFRHPPNIDAVQFIIDKLWPAIRKKKIGANLHIIGSHMPDTFREYAADDIKVVGFVADLEKYLERIKLTIAPLRYGAGVKGKVGNSLRMGVPVVCTPVAAEGMGLVDGKHVLQTSDIDSFADYVYDLYSNAALWEKLSREGQRYVKQTFGIDAATETLSCMVEALIAPKD